MVIFMKTLLLMFLVSTFAAKVSHCQSMSYKEKLEATKEFYPFDKWRKLFQPNPAEDFPGMKQYSPENCDKAQKILDDLINNLSELGEQADEKQKVELFKKAVLKLNALNQQI